MDLNLGNGIALFNQIGWNSNLKHTIIILNKNNNNILNNNVQRRRGVEYSSLTRNTFINTFHLMSYSSPMRRDPSKFFFFISRNAIHKH